MRTQEHLTAFDDLPCFDAPTQEWVEMFEGPSVPVLQTGTRLAFTPIAMPEMADSRAADWWGAQEFPYGSQDGRKAAPQPACPSAAARPLRKFPWVSVTKSRLALSNLQTAELVA